jgi:lysophospholipase L1-like esterase
VSGGQRGARQLGWRLVDVALIVLAVLAAWPAPGRHRVWVPPESVDIVVPGGRRKADDLQSGMGRIVSRQKLLLAFRWLRDPVEISVREPLGPFEMQLGLPGERGAGVIWNGQELLFVVSGSAAGSVSLAAGPPRELTLLHSDQHYRIVADGRPLLPAVAGPPPPSPAAISLQSGSSLAGFECRTAGGETRSASADAPPPGLSRTAWALLSGLAALAWWRAWRPRPGSDAAARRRAAVAGLAVGLALLVGLPFLLELHNAARMVETKPCETAPFASPEPRELLPGRPYELGTRRDGNLRLTATVVLDAGSAFDLLLRTDLPRLDREVIVTLSADPALPSGLSVNLGTSLETFPAPPADACLPAGRELALTVVCDDERTEAAVDGRPLGEVCDFDLRSGRTAFHALAGRAVISDVRLEPLGLPRPLTGILRTWQAGTALVVAASLALLSWCLRRGPGAWLWAWPLASLAVPAAPDGLLIPAVATAALLLLLELARSGRSVAGRVRRALLLPAGAVLLGAGVWALSERPASISTTQLNSMQLADIAGPPVPAAYAWARHPLSRRFNGYLKNQTFRDEVVPLEVPAGTLRIFAIGSSSTFGYGVNADEAWPAQLSGALARRAPGLEIVVVNAGVPGGTAERLRPFLEGVVLRLRPDAVVIDLGFNDHSYGGSRDERGHYRAMTTRGIGPVEAWWARLWEGRRAGSYSAFMAANLRGEASAEDVRRLLLEPAARFGESLRDMVAACRAAGAEVVLVQEPLRPSEQRGNLAVYHAAMADLARAEGVTLLSPQAGLDALGDAAFLDIVHPRAVGHAAIAEAVADAFVRDGLLDSLLAQPLGR